MKNRGVAIVMRNGKVLMEKVFFYNRYFYTVPGGGIDSDETPEEATLRELKEECGLDGEIVKPLAVQYNPDHTEYSFLVRVPDEQEAILGFDPEYGDGEQALKEVCWMGLDEISEKDRAFIWSYGLLNVESVFDECVRWGDEISYPTGHSELK